MPDGTRDGVSPGGNDATYTLRRICSLLRLPGRYLIPDEDKGGVCRGCIGDVICDFHCGGRKERGRRPRTGLPAKDAIPPPPPFRFAVMGAVVVEGSPGGHARSLGRRRKLARPSPTTATTASFSESRRCRRPTGGKAREYRRPSTLGQNTPIGHWHRHRRRLKTCAAFRWSSAFTNHERLWRGEGTHRRQGSILLCPPESTTGAGGKDPGIFAMSKTTKTTTTLGRPGESTSPPPDRDLRRLRCAPILESTPSVLVWCVAIMIGPSTTEWREERKRDDTIGDRWPDAARASCADLFLSPYRGGGSAHMVGWDGRGPRGSWRGVSTASCTSCAPATMAVGGSEGYC